VRTPSFISGPLIPTDLAGTHFKGLFHVTDWAPTILQLARQSVDGWGIDGVSQAAALLSKSLLARGVMMTQGLTTCRCRAEGSSEPRTEVLLNYQNVSVEIGGLIVGKWKYLLNEVNQSWYTEDDMASFVNGDDEGACTEFSGKDVAGNWLFDIEADPFEKNNLIDVYPDTAAAMKEKIYTFLTRGVKTYFNRSDADTHVGIFDSLGFISPWLDKDTSYFLPPRYEAAFPDSDPDINSMSIERHNRRERRREADTGARR
jgi:arylsulfatase A-like enzyme